MNIHSPCLPLVVGLLPVVAIIGIGCGKQSPEVPSDRTSAQTPLTHSIPADEPSGDVAKLKPDFFLDAAQLAEEITKDSMAALKKYKGKVLELKGSIARLATTQGHGPVFFLESNKGGKKNLVGFVLSESRPWRKYVFGQQLTVRGKVTNNVWVLEPCEVVESTKSNAEALTAPQLDEGAEKYRGKPVLVTGTIVDKKDDKTYNALCIELKGGPERNIECLFLAKDESLESLKKGQKVKVQGEFFDTGVTSVRLIDCFLIEP